MNDTNFDINRVISDLVLETGKRILNSVGGFGKQQYKAALATFEVCFHNYLKHSYERYSKTKSILYRDKPVSLSRFYVATDVTIGKRNIGTDDIDMLVGDSTRQVFVGTAGCGKSTFLKHLFTGLIERKRLGVPVFVELRYLNTSPDTLLLDFVFSSLREANKKFDRDQFERSMTSGKLILILDGFDEVNFALRTSVAKDILSISTAYPQARIMVASRPDEMFDSWQEFSKYQVQPLTKDQAVALVEKLDYDEKTKSRFLKELQNGLYERHKDFLSNPLLLTMMLLTYEQIAEIPSKMHIFYNQAFETLFNRHDALKCLYKRKTYTEMPIDDFKRVLSAFSMTSYAKRHVSFTREDVDVFLNSAKKLTNLDFSNEKFLNDLLESVCILYRDGLYYTYTHRSFQEYFAAHFLSYFNSPRREQLLAIMVSGAPSDNVLRLLFEMNLEAVEQDLIMPMFKKALTDTENVKGGVYRYARILDLWFKGLSVIHDDELGYQLSADKPFQNLLFFVYNMYPELAKRFHKGKKHDRNTEARKKLVRRIFENVPERLIPFIPITKEKHEVFLKLGCKDFVNERLAFIRSFLEHLKMKYANRAEDIDALLFK